MRGFSVIPASEAPTPDRPWLRCLTCDQAVVDHPPATAAHRRHHRARPLLRRSPILTVAERSIRAQVFERDTYRCQLRGITGAGDCYGPLTPHHRRKASQGGRYVLANLVTLCRHHNDQLEARADIAALGERLGLVLRRTARVSQVPATLDEAS